MKLLPPIRRMGLALAATAVAAGAMAGCSDDSDTITVGSADFPESVLLAEIYAEALRSQGLEVDTQHRIGAREAYTDAIEGGEVDLIPEYTGNLLAFYDPETTAAEPEEIYRALEGALPENLTVLEMSAAESKDAVVVTSETAEEFGLTTIGDLAPHASEMVLGGPPEWRDRPTGISGLRDVYGLEFAEFRPADSTQNPTFLANGQIDAANIFTTDPSIPENGFVVLEDPENLFPAQNVVPLINEEKVNPDVRQALNGVSADLDTETLADLGSRVIADNEDPAAVAKDWLGGSE